MVLEGYVAPTKTERTIEKRKIETKDGVEEKDVVVSEFQIPKPKIEWTVEEKAMSVYNQKGIHAIFAAVSSEQFAHIRNCKTSKEAWDNLMISKLCPVKKTNKNLALKVIKEENDDCNEIDLKQLALITRHFQKLLKKQNSKGSGSSTRSSINKMSKDRSQRFIPKFEGRKCYACSGYGHEAKECVNTISKQKEEKKALKASYNSWSDSESDMFEAEEEEIAFVALENNDESDDSDEEDVDIEETRERYKELYLNFDK
ncbi:unnamed protein product, partial [Prunus brigantina]